MAPKKKKGKFQNKETPTVDSFYETMPKKKEKKGSRRFTAVILIIVLLVLGLVGGVFALDQMGYYIPLPGSAIPAGVSVAGVDIGGLKKAEAIEAVTAAIGDSYTTTPMVVTVLDQQLEITPSLSGAVLDVESAVRAARRHGTEKNPQLQVDLTPYLSLNTEGIRQKIAELAVNFPTDGITTGSQIIKETVDGTEVEMLEVTLGTVYYDFSEDVLYNAIIAAYNDHKFAATYNCNVTEAAAIDLDALYAEHCYAAVDAVLDPETHEVTQSADGYRFDLDAAREALSAANPGDVLKFPFEVVLPNMDTETLKSMLFRDELATYTAYQSSSSNRATNLRLACEALNGLILYPGDTFSYNDTLGQRTPEKGYKPAAAYMAGETVQSYGGGICQPSSALYYCTLLADLEIVRRHCHTYPSSYVPFGMDATVSWGGPDFQFRNNTEFPIRIDAKADGGSVTITLVGTETKDYYVKMEYDILGVSSPKVEYIETKDKSKDGVVKTAGHTGYTVQSYKLKYSKETDELLSREKEAYSVYSTQTKVVYKYKGDPKPPATEPAPTEPKPADPAPTPPPADDGGSGE